MSNLQIFILLYVVIGLFFASVEISKQIDRIAKVIKGLKATKKLTFKFYLRVLLAITIVVIRSLIITTSLWIIVLFYQIRNKRGIRINEHE